MARDLLTPHFVHSTAFLVLAVALIGTTITPYMQFYVASAVVDKNIGPEEYPAERVDTVNGAILSDIVSIFIIIATAAAIGGSGPLASAREAAAALRPVVGSAAPVLFGAGLLGASLLAAMVVPLSSSYAIAEAVGAERSVSDSFRRAPLFFGLFTVQLVVGAAVALLPGKPRLARREHAGAEWADHAGAARLHPRAREPPRACSAMRPTALYSGPSPPSASPPSGRSPSRWSCSKRSVGPDRPRTSRR